MTLDSLIEMLEDLRDQHDGSCEVRMMQQPRWPFEWSIAGVVTSDLLGEGLADLDEEELEDIGARDEDVFDPAPREDGSEDHPIIYLCEGSQLGYGSSAAWDQMERAR